MVTISWCDGAAATRWKTASRRATGKDNTARCWWRWGVQQNSCDAVVGWRSHRGRVRPVFRSAVASGWDDSTVAARWNVAACTAVAKVSLVRCWQRWDGTTGQDDGAAVAGSWMVDLPWRTTPILRDAGGVGMGRQHCFHVKEQHSLHSSGRSKLGGVLATLGWDDGAGRQDRCGGMLGG